MEGGGQGASRKGGGGAGGGSSNEDDGNRSEVWSNNTDATGGGRKATGKEVAAWEEADDGDGDMAAVDAAAYCLFPPRQVGTRRNSLFRQPQPQDDPSSEILTPDHRKVPTNADANRDINNLKVQTQLPIQTTKEPTFLELLVGEEDFDLPPLIPEDANFDNSPTRIRLPKMSFQDNNAIGTAELKPPGQISNHENIVSGSSVGSGPKFPGSPAKVEQDSQITVLNKHDFGGLPVQTSSSSSSFSSSSSSSSSSTSSSSMGALGNFAEIMAVQEAYVRALFDPDQSIPLKLMRQSIEALKNHYALDVEMSYSGKHPANTVALGTGRISGFSQIQHSGGRPDNIHHSNSGLNSRNSEFQFLLRQIKYPTNHSIRLIHIKGHVPAFSADPFGSRFIQQKLGTATAEEIIMVYEEIMPHVHTLVIDVFANYAIQKLLEHGPPFYRRKLISNLIGHVLSLSLHLYGCRVIQKAFEISDLNQKIEMAKELGSNLLKCICDQNANHVVQKCLVCVPPQYIQFIYTSFCGKVKMLSAHPYGCRVVQKVLECCDDPEILHVWISEIVEAVNELSADQFGNYVVQHILEHGGPRERLIIVMKFAGRIVHMSYQKFSSNVIEKCLIYGSYQDRQLITNEILCARGGQTADHLLGMMINQYANYVIQKMIDTADDWQRDVIVDVVRRNVRTLIKYTHGKHVIAQVEKLLRARERRMLLGRLTPGYSR